MSLARALVRPLASPLSTALTVGGRGGFSPASLSGLQLLLDSSDWATGFQDAAGSTAITAVEQPAGRRADKSGLGRHATQATAAARPVLSARVNLFDATEFRNGVTDAPTRGGLISATAFAGFAGGIAFGHDGVTASYAYKNFPFVAGTTYAISVFVRMDDGGAPVIGATNGTGDFRLIANGAPPADIVATHIGDGVYRVSGIRIPSGTTNIWGVIKYAEQSNRTFKVTGYQVELGTTATRYQRVTTATDYDWQGFPLHDKFDGVDDSQTITFGSSLGSACTVARSLPGVGAQILTGQTIGTSYTRNTSSHALAIINRALTAGETELLTHWLNMKAGR